MINAMVGSPIGGSKNFKPEVSDKAVKLEDINRKSKECYKNVRDYHCELVGNTNFNFIFILLQTYSHFSSK